MREMLMDTFQLPPATKEQTSLSYSILAIKHSTPVIMNVPSSA